MKKSSVDMLLEAIRLAEKNIHEKSIPLPERCKEIIAPAFYDLRQKIQNEIYTHYVLEGGRGSTKSSFVSVAIIEDIETHPDAHAICWRKIKEDLRDSVFAQMLWAINELGLNEFYTATVSPMQIIKKSTGQKIFFRGMDDATKSKSIKPPFGYIRDIWYEEYDQFSGSSQIRTANQSLMRGGDHYNVFYSYNPPISINNWVNEDAQIERPDKLVHHSDYLTVPKEWLGETFLAEAEYLKITNERAYKHEYLGLPVGTGGNVFENIEERTITAQEIKGFDRIYQGIDFGWYPDPFVFVRLYYSRATETIYFIDEITNNKTSNKDNAKKIKKCGYQYVDTLCDREMKSISDLREFGVRAHPAIKGPGSIRAGIEWLQSRKKIVIDKKRTPTVRREFVYYEYERNRAGEIISGYPDSDNHSIDATRYSLEKIWRKRGA